ncbi:MAG: hypothetical protein ACI9Z3_001363, partial [Roseivirga sp.]
SFSGKKEKVTENNTQSIKTPINKLDFCGKFIGVKDSVQG